MSQFESVNARDGLVECKECGELCTLGISGICPYCGDIQEDDGYESYDEAEDWDLEDWVEYDPTP